MATATKNKKKLTIMLDSDVYDGLRAKVGGRRIGSYISDLARPHVVLSDLEAGYKAMAADKEYNQEADEWTEGTLEAPEGENDW